MGTDEKQWSSVREAFVYWANKRKKNSVRSYASVREAILALADNESKSHGGGGGGDLGGLFTIIYETVAGEEVIDYAIGNEEFLFAKDLKILTEEAADLFNSTRYTDDPYELQDGDILNITDLLRHLILEDITPEPDENDSEQEVDRVLRIRAYNVEGLYSDGYISARGADNTAITVLNSIDEEELWDILGAVGNYEQINLSHLSTLQNWVSNNFYSLNGSYSFVTESDLLNNYTIWGQKFNAVSGNSTQKEIVGNMSNVGNISMSGLIYFGNDTNVALGRINNNLNSTAGFYSSSFVSARGVDSTMAQPGSDFDVDEMWDELATNDSSHKIHNSHLNSDIVTTSILNSTLANYLSTTSLETELNNYTIWGAHFVNKVISGNMSNVGNISMNGNINYVGNIYFNSANTIYLTSGTTFIRSSVGFYSSDYVSARGVDSTAGIGGSDFDTDEMWQELATVDATKLIDQSHISGFVKTSELGSAIQTTLQGYTVWGRQLVPVTNGDMTGVGNITMSGNITMGSNTGTISGLETLYFGSDATKYLGLNTSYLRSSIGLYSDIFISTRGADPSALSANDFDENDFWDLLENTSSGHYINAHLIPLGSGLAVSNGVIVNTGGGGGGGTYTLPVATNNILGGIMIGYATDTSARKYAIELSNDKAYALVSAAASNAFGVTKLYTDTALTVGTSLPLSLESSRTYGIGKNNLSQLAVYVPWMGYSFSSTSFSTSTNSSILTNVTLRQASSSYLGGIYIKNTRSSSLSSSMVSGGTDNYYAVELDSDGIAFVNIPTGGGATYYAGTGISIDSSNNISVNYGSTNTTACVGNDARLSDSRPASDVYPWAKAASKPSYSYSEISNTPTIPTKTSQLTNDSGFITDAGVTKITTTAGAHTTITNSTGAVSFKVPTKTSHLTNDSSFITDAGVTKITTTAGSHTTITNSTGAVSFNVPTKTSHLSNDSGFITSYINTTYKLTLNGTTNGDSTNGVNLGSFYAPTSAGTSGYILNSGGSNTAPSWTNNPTLTGGLTVGGTGSGNGKTTTLYGTLTLGNYISSGNRSLSLTVGYNSNYSGTTYLSIDKSVVSGGKFYDASDIRLKTNIEKIISAIGKIKQIPIIRYEYKNIEDNKFIGTIAQDLMNIYPELVAHGTDGFYSVDYGGLAAIAIAGIQDLEKRIEMLEEKLYGYGS